MLWFDLMFDVQALGHRERELPEDVLASIAGYYRRVTTTAHPMSRLIAAVMLATLGALIAQVAGDDTPAWVAWASLALAAAAILVAGSRTVPGATRLGARTGTIEQQSVLARSILREHLFCLAAIAALLVLQLAAA